MAAYPVVYCVFDLLEIDGEELTHRPLAERRSSIDAGNPAERGPATLRGLAGRRSAAV